MPSRRRSLLQKAVAGFVGGAVLAGAAYAGTVTDLPGFDAGETLEPVSGEAASTEAKAAAAAIGEQAGDGLTPPDLSGLQRLPAGEFLVGAAVTSLAPDPARWQTEGCTQWSPIDPASLVHLPEVAANVQPRGWPRSPDCIYLGGYGIGPARAATGVDPFAGVNVRSLAITNGDEVVVWQMLDMVGFFAKYRDDLCDGCGILDIRQRIEAETGIPTKNVAIGSTHTHGGADGYGAWGGMPTWYREQIRDQVVRSAYDALRALKPATLTVGAVDARVFNGERRDTYYSTPDYGAAWLQARTRAKKPAVIATLVNFAAHPTELGDQHLLHGDWPGAMSKVLGDRLGGVGLVMEGGLGNVSPNRPRSPETDLTGDGVKDDYDDPVQMGIDFTSVIAGDIARRNGHRLMRNEIATDSRVVEHPITNWIEAGGALVGVLDREFTPGEGAGPGMPYRWSKQDPAGAGGVRACATEGPLSVKTEVSGFRIGELTVLTGPGELFSNMTEVVKSKARRDAFAGGQTMVFAQTQDSLGYIIQSFEVDPAGGALTYADVNGSPAEYEEFFMLDRCFGDHVLQTQLDIASTLDAWREPAG